eukprot:4230623-Alexandrium_andersonii.AAC.1
MHPSRASGSKCEAIPGPAQFKLRTPQAISYFLGLESSGELQGALGSSGEFVHDQLTLLTLLAGQ